MFFCLFLKTIVFLWSYFSDRISLFVFLWSYFSDHISLIVFLWSYFYERTKFPVRFVSRATPLFTKKLLSLLKISLVQDKTMPISRQLWILDKQYNTNLLVVKYPPWWFWPISAMMKGEKDSPTYLPGHSSI